ncbi:MAG: hypothetical protein U9N41_07530 [Euryarchaeota archaeon]|nr:hypothetical protein [Euryarchaeota archaeon]
MVKKKRILVIVIVLGILLVVLGSLSILGIIDLIILLRGVLAFIAEHLMEGVIFLFGSGIALWVITMLFKRYFDRKKEQQQEEKKLEGLLDELKMNKKWAGKDNRSGYQLSAYEDVDRANYLLDISDDLRDKIHEAYSIIKTFYYDKENVNFPKKIPELKELLEDIIPKFEEYLKKI